MGGTSAAEPVVRTVVRVKHDDPAKKSTLGGFRGVDPVAIVFVERPEQIANVLPARAHLLVLFGIPRGGVPVDGFGGLETLPRDHDIRVLAVADLPPEALAERTQKVVGRLFDRQAVGKCRLDTETGPPVGPWIAVGRRSHRPEERP